MKIYFGDKVSITAFPLCTGWLNADSHINKGGNMKRYAVHVLYTEHDTMCRQQVVMVEDGRCVGHCPLTEELPFTEWMGGVAVLSGWEETDCRLPASFEEVVHKLLSKPGDRVWHIEATDHACGTVRRLRRLL